MGDADIAFFASYPNEGVALDHVRRHLRGLTVADLTISKRNCFSPAALAAIPAFQFSAIRLWRLARLLVRRFHFMPACRIFSTVTFHARFRRLLASRDVRAVFIANHYSPECLALAVAAHAMGKKVLFTNHANATGDSGYAPPLYSDLAAVTGQAVLDIYSQGGRRDINAVFVSPASPQGPMRARVDQSRPITIGIFLTALTDTQWLRSFVSQLRQDPGIARILIRPHPVKVVNEDLSALSSSDGRVVETEGMKLFDNIEQCDVAVVGSSTVAIEILRAGRPVFYGSDLDRCHHDFNGYLKRKLVLPLPSKLDAAAFRSLSHFYGDPSWAGRMSYFDASYGRDEAAMFDELNDAVRKVVKGNCWPVRGCDLPLAGCGD